MTRYTQKLTRGFIMDLFRSEEIAEILTNDDRVEIFCQILPGSSDITKELLEEIFIDYGIDHLKIIQVIR